MMVLDANGRLYACDENCTFHAQARGSRVRTFSELGPAGVSMLGLAAFGRDPRLRWENPLVSS